MKVLVTGHEGFIGSNMIDYLMQEGWTVDGWEWNKTAWPDIRGYDWVVHLGAIADMTDCDVDKILYQNLEFSQWLFNECDKHTINLQYASSSSVYGNTTDFRETSIGLPQTPYAWSKYLFDRWVDKQQHSNCVQGFRYFNVYGKNMELRGHRANAIHKWRRQASTHGKITVWDTAQHVSRDWTCVDDICKLHVDFIKTVTKSGIWNVGPGHPYDFFTIANHIAQKENVLIELETIPQNEYQRMRNITCADLTNLTQTIGPRSWVDVIDWIDND